MVQCTVNNKYNLITLKSQADVDWFRTAGCTEVQAGISVSGDVQDLSPLQNLTSVGVATVDGGSSFSLLIFATGLETLSGLRGSALATVPGSIWVTECPQLRSLDGLQSIHSAGDLTISDCPMLQSLDGLEGVSRTRSLHLQGLPALQNLRGLQGLTGAFPGSFPGHINITIADCSVLQSLEGLDHVSSARDLFLQHLPQLKALRGLHGLEGSLGNIHIADCPELQSLEGLDRVSSAHTLWLQHLPELKDLQGLQGLRQVTDFWQGGITIFNCSSLQSLGGLEGVNTAGTVLLQHLPLLQDLRGLRGLEGALRGGLWIWQCGSLASLDGLGALSGLGVNSGRSLSLFSLPNLTSLAPLGGIGGRLPGGISIWNCQALVSLEGLNNISGLGAMNDGISIDLHYLTVASLNGLNGLRGRLDGGLRIYSCPQLLGLEGLENVTMLGSWDRVGDSIVLVQLPSLRSVAALGGLNGPLPGGLRIHDALVLRDLEGLQGLSSVCSEAPNCAISIVNSPSLQLLLGLRGLKGRLQGSLRLVLGGLRTLEGLGGITRLEGELVINCANLESTQGIGSLTAISGDVAILSSRLQDLAAVSEDLTFMGIVIVVTGGPLCGRDKAFEQLSLSSAGTDTAALQIPEGEPPHCHHCSVPCGEYEGRRITCDLLRGGCRCPLGRAGPGCPEAPVLDVALPQHREVRISGPLRTGSEEVRRVDLCVPLWRTWSVEGGAAVRLKEAEADRADVATLGWEPGDVGYSLLPPFNNVTWSSHNPTRGCLWVHLEMRRGLSSTPPLRLALAYENPSRGRYPDHLINGTLGENLELWDHPWPECLDIGTCRQQQNETALTVHFVEQEDCPKDMELDYSACEATQCDAALPNSGSSPSLQMACECHQGHALQGRCVAKEGFWEHGKLAVPCPFSFEEKSTCLGGNLCAEGYEGDLCAACPAGQVQQSGSGSCSTCGSGQGFLCVVVTLLFLAAAISLPRLLSSKRLRSCLSRHVGDRWARLRTKLKITSMTIQELLLFSWGFLLRFPAVMQQLGGFHAVEVLAKTLDSLAFPAFLQCGCGVSVFGEFGMLVAAPAVFVLVASVSACWGAWRPNPDVRRVASRCCELWQERSGPQLVFCALHFTFSPLSALIIVYAPVRGLGFHCLGEKCFLRRDYRMLLDSPEYASFLVGWGFAVFWQVCSLLGLLLCLRETQRVGTDEGAMAFFCSDFKPKQAYFGVVNLVRQTVLAGLVLLFPGDSSLTKLVWCVLVSAAYLAVLLLVDPYQERGDHLQQCFNTLGGMVIFTALMAELVLASSSAGDFFEGEAVEDWVRPFLQTTVSVTLFSVGAAPFCEVILGPVLQRFSAWRDGAPGPAAAGGLGPVAPAAGATTPAPAPAAPRIVGL